MYQTLYRKYRPTYFDEVVGQKVIVKTLKNAIENNRLNHAYLFTGPRGTGKTSVAKILAKTINCENLKDLTPCNQCVVCTQINNKQTVDIIEIDAASNNGVDEIRELKSKVNLVPSVGKYKVYIIDEVHMLTTGAFNALLKTLEEPPEHIVFILATTEPHKIPATILSRCQRFDFKKIHENDIYSRLKQISQLEKIKIDDESIMEISRLADGGLRDALSLLDQVIAYASDSITIEDVHEINGTLTPTQLKLFIEYLTKSDVENLFQLIEQYDENGKNFVKLAEELILFLKNCLLLETVPNYVKENVSNTALYEIESLNKDKILQFIQVFNQSIYDMKLSNYPKILFETCLISVMNVQPSTKEQPEKIIEKQVEIKRTEEVHQEIKKTVPQKQNTMNEQDNLENLSIITQLKKVRINNTLCQFNKKELVAWKEKLKRLEIEITNEKYGQIVSLILDGELKAVGNYHFLFVYENVNLVNLLNENINLADELFEMVFHEKIKTIATDIEDWNQIKQEYNGKMKKYEYQEEPPEWSNQLKHKEEKSEIENLFQNIIEYEK